jgi:hypothetical protein
MTCTGRNSENYAAAVEARRKKERQGETHKTVKMMVLVVLCFPDFKDNSNIYHELLVQRGYGFFDHDLAYNKMVLEIRDNGFLWMHLFASCKMQFKFDVTKVCGLH